MSQLQFPKTICGKLSIKDKNKSALSHRCNKADSSQDGGDLLSHFRSTIGAAELNFSVRNGKRWNLRAVTTVILLCGHRRHGQCVRQPTYALSQDTRDRTAAQAANGKKRRPAAQLRNTFSLPHTVRNTGKRAGN